MGGAASALPEKLSEEELKGLCQDKFDQAKYDAMKDGEGFVTKEQFLTLVQSGEEKEVLDLYTSFCPQGEMDSRTFLKFCKDTKLLKKNAFTSTDCDLIFQKAKNHQGSASKSIMYETFRNFVMPIIAEKTKLGVEGLMKKLARAEGPVLTGTHAEAVRFHDDKSTFTGAHAQGGPSIGKNDTGGVAMEGLLDRKEGDVRGRAVATDEELAAQNKAALKMQNATRSKVAMKRVQSLKEIKAVENMDNVGQHFDKDLNAEDESEIRCQQVFMKYCEKTNGEMDSKTFIKYLKDTDLIARKFTSGDADLVFQKTKAMASAPSAGSYSSGVVHGKRVSFQVFRAVAIPNLATKTGSSIASIVTTLGSVDGPVMTNVTTAQANKFHDDQSTFTGTHAVAKD
jgi:hypothetical protein